MKKNKAILSVLTSTFLTLSLLVPNVKAETNSFNMKRIYGNDRYGTCVKLCNDCFKSAKNIVLVNGNSFADALCASVVANKMDAPIMLCDDKLKEDVKNEIIHLGPNNAYLVGGQGVVSYEIEDELKSMNINCTRLAGKDRFETSEMVAKFIGTKKGCFLTSGLDFPDALSIASIAAQKQMPILLSQKSGLTDSLKRFVKSENINVKYIIGGEGVLNKNVQTEFPNAKRLAGKDRYQTDAAVLNEFKKDLSFDKVYLTVGNKFPDALCATSPASLGKSPVILVDIYGAYATKDFVKNNSIKSENIVLLGGPSIMPNTILEKKEPPKPKPIPKPVVKPRPVNINSLVTSGAVYAQVTNSIKGLPKGVRVEIVKDNNNGTSYNVYYRGRYYYSIPRRYLWIPHDPATNNSRMTTNQLEAYVNSHNFSSNTPYFVWVDINRQRINIFKGSKNRWKLYNSFSCASGRNVTPTIRGNFVLQDRGPSFPGAIDWIRFYGNYLFHSILVNSRGQVIDPTIGKRASHGCVRVGIPDIRWMYNNLPRGTAVWTN